MSNYRRLISYIYAYEGGIKGKNVGFAKLEVRNGQCKIQVNVRNVFIGSQDTGVFLLSESKELLVGKVFIRNGAGEFRAIVPVTNIAGSGQNIDQCYGLTVHNLSDSWQSYTTIWEDAVAHAAEVALEEATSEKIEQRDPKPELKEGLVADAVEAEIEAQSRMEEQARRRKEEPLPPSAVPAKETDCLPELGTEPAEVGAMEIRPMEVLPIVGKREDNTGKESDSDMDSAKEPEADSGKVREEETGRRAGGIVQGVKQVQSLGSMTDEGPEQNPGPAWGENTAQSRKSGAGDTGAAEDSLMFSKRSMMQEADGTEAESGAAATVEESTELIPDTRIQSDPESSELKVFTPKQTFPNANMASGCPESQPQSQHSRSDRMNLFGLPGWWSQQSRQSLWNQQTQFGHQGQFTQQGQPDLQRRSAQQSPFGGQIRTRTRGESGNRGDSRPEIGQPLSPLTQPEIPQPAGPSVQPEIPQPAGPSVQPEIPQPAGPSVQPEIPQPAGPSVQPENPQPAGPAVQPEIPQPADPTMQHGVQQPSGPKMGPMEEEPRIEAIWQEFYKRYPKIQAFDYNGGCEILTIKPQDIGLLPREIWGYGNNSFLLHGYYSHRYIIFARLGGQKGRSRYLLGVPGHYYSNEKYMASMFGFPNFVLSKIQPEGDGRFGYWYTDVRLGN